MAGALIVRGDRLPRDNHRDVDVILRNRRPDRDWKIAPWCCSRSSMHASTNNGRVKVQTAQNPLRIIAWVCDRNDVGVIEKYGYPNNGGVPGSVGFGPGEWEDSGRFHHHQRAGTPDVSGTRRPSRALAADPWRRPRHHHLRLP